MILSKYTSCINDFPFAGGVTVFHLITKQMVYLDDKASLSSLDSIEEETRKYMYDNGFIFFNKAEEKQYIQNVMCEKYNTDDHLDITVVTSQNCNLQCVYCFEGSSSNHNMSMETCNQLLNEIDQMMERYSKRSLYIHYYGGEPLMNVPIIRKMNAYLSNKYGENFKFGLVTNGVLLTKELVAEWKDQGFTRIKITLDGEKEFNDKRRIAKDGKSTYDRVIENLGLLPDNTDNVLHLVVDQSNYQHIENMLIDMVNRGYHKKICICISHTHPYYDIPQSERAALVLNVAKLVKQYGFVQNYLIGVDGEGICPHKDHNSFLVDVDGSKYKCTGFMGLKNSPVGRYHGFTDKYINDDEACMDCKYLPACNGGCIYIKELQGGRKHCQKEYFDSLLPELLKVYIDYELSD